MGGIIIKRLTLRACVNRINQTEDSEFFLRGTTHFLGVNITLDHITPKENTKFSIYWSTSQTRSSYKSWQTLLVGLRKKFDQAPFELIVNDPDVYYDTVQNGYIAHALVSGDLEHWKL